MAIFDLQKVACFNQVMAKLLFQIVNGYELTQSFSSDSPEF